MPDHLTGSYRVRALRPAFHDAKKWFPRTADRMEVRRHALKLRFWPEPHPTDEGGHVLDLDWCWIRALAGLRIGELRVHDTIGGHDNIRIIFFDPQWPAEPLPNLWVLAVFQKKRDDFTKANLDTFKARRMIVIERGRSGLAF